MRGGSAKALALGVVTIGAVGCGNFGVAATAGESAPEAVPVRWRLPPSHSGSLSVSMGSDASE
eukprot:1175042-Pyramimonas_sp.AAC.1